MMRNKRWVSVLLALAMVLGMGIQSQASAISDAQKKGEELKDQKETAQAEQAELNKQLEELLADMQETADAIQTKHEEIDEKATELMQAELEEAEQYDSMKKRIKFMYENGNTQFVEVLFEAESIGDFLNNAEYITQISKYDRDMLEEFQTTVQTVKESKEALEEEKADLEELQGELQSKEGELNTLIAEKSEEIDDLDAAIGENAKKLKKLQEEAARQQQMQQQAQGGGNSGNYTPGPSIPPSGNGRLTNPCPSAYISSEFGGRPSPGGIGSTNHKGRDYAAPAGDPIYAAASGIVIVSDYNVARGWYVQIRHDNGLSTLYQHCSAILVNVGQSVTAGTNIARVGSTGYSTGPHLHFEVWVGGTPVDPRLYL